MSYRKVFCLFEQSGTFKKEFHRLGIPAEDFDLLDDYGETDRQIDLFQQIHAAYCGMPSIFDEMKPEDLVVAFFPCTWFSKQKILDYRSEKFQDRHMSDRAKVEKFKEQQEALHNVLDYFCELILIAIDRNLKLVIENPYDSQHYLVRYFPIKAKLIIPDRHDFGDYYKKPTQFFFINLEPSLNLQFDDALGFYPIRKVERERGADRSMMSPEFAHWFIKTNLLKGD